MREALCAKNEAKIVHNLVRKPKGSSEHDHYTTLQIRSLLSLIASEVAS